MQPIRQFILKLKVRNNIDMKALEKIISEQIANMEVNDLPAGMSEMQEVYLDRTEKDNSKWLNLITEALKTAKHFEIHCWNEEEEWIEVALKYGTMKESDWAYGKIITGTVTVEFSDMLLGLPKPKDTEIYNKMTPFFNVFFDNGFQSSHYGTEIYVEEK